MRFTIRDVLWLTALVGVALTLGVGWWREHFRSPTAMLEFRAESLEAALRDEGWIVEQSQGWRLSIKLKNAARGEEREYSRPGQNSD
jgi:hypothetical protein